MAKAYIEMTDVELKESIAQKEADLVVLSEELEKLQRRISHRARGIERAKEEIIRRASESGSLSLAAMLEEDGRGRMIKYLEAFLEKFHLNTQRGYYAETMQRAVSVPGYELRNASPEKLELMATGIRELLPHLKPMNGERQIFCNSKVIDVGGWTLKLLIDSTGNISLVDFSSIRIRRKGECLGEFSTIEGALECARSALIGEDE